jgi:hypothetical protein
LGLTRSNGPTGTMIGQEQGQTGVRRPLMEKVF